jgi:outer membrane protein
MVRLASLLSSARRSVFTRPFTGPGFRHVATATVAALVLCVAPLASAQSMRVAVVDTQRAVMESEDGLRAQATLKKLFDKRQRELDQKQKDLQKEREELEKNRAQINTEAMAKRVETWQREMAQVQAVFVEYNKELQQKQNELTQPIVQKTVGIIRRLATQDGFDVVLERQAATYFRADLDLTDRVITLYNRGGDAPAAPAAAPAAAPPAKK